jgi:predicted neutral ceramidase superfamily lipid hydrolase
MSNESHRLSINKEEDLLVSFYHEILEGKEQASTAHQKKFLLQLLNTKITQLESKTVRIKRLHFLLSVTAMLLSATTTVLLGLKYDEAILPQVVSNTALIVSAVMTFISGLSVFWDTENYWIRNKIMLNKLKEIRYEYVFYLSGAEQVQTKELKLFLDKFLSSLGDEYWEKFLNNAISHANNNP